MGFKRGKGIVVAWLAFAALSVTHGASPTEASAGDPPPCGSRETPCPLQKWMRINVGGPMAASDLAAVADGLTKSASMSPDPAWKAWATIARKGADAARKGDVVGAKASCKACHDAFKDTYKEKFRTRPVP